MRDGLAFHYAILTTDEILARRYVVVRLSDGNVEPTAYPSRHDAMRHAPGLESLYAYLQLPLERMPAEACDVLLWYVRAAYDNGFRPDPANPDVGLIIPGSLNDVFGDIAGRRRPGI
jgi:hypothetical protein